MNERIYPYTAWALQPSFKPVQVTLIGCYHSWGNGADWDQVESGKLYSVANELFPTKEAAIAAGWERIHAQETKLAKMQTSIDKKREALAKAATETVKAKA